MSVMKQKTEIRRASGVQTVRPAETGSAQSGRGLIELLVSIAVGLIVLSTVLAIYLTTSKTTTQSTQEAEMNEDGALALNILQQQLKLVGYSNYVTAVGATPTGAPAATPAPAPAAGSGRNFQGAHIFGCKNGFNSSSVAFDSLACKASTTSTGGSNGSSAFAIRYEADTINTFAANNNPTNCSFQEIKVGTNSDADPGVQYRLADNRYYIAKDAANGNRPTLYCQGMNGGTATAATALVANVEQMVVTYAVRQPLPAGSPTGTPPSEQIAGYVAADHTALGATKSNWQDQVIGVNICLLMTSREAVARETIKSGVTDSYVDCNGVRRETKTAQAAQSGDKKDGRIRRAYTTTVMFRNVLGMTPPQAASPTP